MFQFLYRYATVAPGGTSTESSGDEISTHSDSTDEVIELKGDQFQHMSDSRVNLSVYDIWALGLTTAMGGHFYLWSACLIAGFGSFLIATVIISAAFGCLVLSMAELAGSLPFAGGAYGVTRVTMGSYPGFLVACCDAYQSMFYTMLSVLVVGFMIGYAAETDRSWQPVYWLAIYASYVGIHAWGGPMYWKVMNILSIGSLLILVMYILGCIKYGDFDRYAPIHEKNGAGEVEEVWFKGGIDMFLKILPIPCWFFVGIESVNLAAHDTQNPKRDIPRGYVSSYITVLLSTLATIFVAVSVFPGSQYLPYSLNPQSWAFMKMFDINLQHATALSIAPIYTSGFGFTYYYASQVRAMGKSGLAPLWLGYDIPHRNTPVPALIFGAIVGFLIGLRYFFWEAIQHESLFSVSLQGAVIVYCSQFISFIMFRLYYPTIKREFVSPVGIAGAIFGICVFLLVFIILAGLEASPGIIAFAVYIAVLTAYYFLVVVHRQIFSEEEKTVLFKAYLMKSNRMKADRVRTGRSHGIYAVRRYALGLFGQPIQEPRKKPSPRHHSAPAAGKGATRNSSDRTEGGATMRLYGNGQPATGIDMSDLSPKAGSDGGILGRTGSGKGVGVAYPQRGTGTTTAAMVLGLASRSSDKTETTQSIRYKAALRPDADLESSMRDQLEAKLVLFATTEETGAVNTTTGANTSADAVGGDLADCELGKGREKAYFELPQHDHEDYVERDVVLRDLRPGPPGADDSAISGNSSQRDLRLLNPDDLV